MKRVFLIEILISKYGFLIKTIFYKNNENKCQIKKNRL